MFSSEELKIIYVAMLKQFENTNQQILNYTSLLSRCKDKFEAITDETNLRLLALKHQAASESELLTKIFKLWKGGTPYAKNDEKKS